MRRGRKPKPPLVNLRIEGLSTGIDLNMKDDWTGKVIEQPNAQVPTSVSVLRKHAQDARERPLRHTASVVNKLVHAMIDPSSAKVLPKPKHNQVHTESKLVITIPPNPNAIKRRF